MNNNYTSDPMWQQTSLRLVKAGLLSNNEDHEPRQILLSNLFKQGRNVPEFQLEGWDVMARLLAREIVKLSN